MKYLELEQKIGLPQKRFIFLSVNKYRSVLRRQSRKSILLMCHIREEKNRALQTPLSLVERLSF